MDLDVTEWYHDRRYSHITERSPDPKLFANFYKTNRQEFILRPGEMIFIPSGMFHFVFSEDPDPETGLCMAINFWYDTLYKGDEGDLDEKAKFGWHDIHLKFDEIFNIIKSKKLKVHTSRNKYFPPRFMRHRYKGVSEDFMSFNDFYEAKNSEHYVAQFKCQELEKFAISHKNSIKDSAIWMNWGNCHTIPHYDGMDNWLCQLKGTRRVILIPQSDRELMYLLNPYPVKLLKKIFDNYQKAIEKHDFIHRENGTLNSDIRDQLLEHGDAIIECILLEQSYERELETRKPIQSHSRWKTFKIKKYLENEEVPNEDYIGILWFLTEGKVQIQDDIIDVDCPGCTVSFSAKIPVKVLSDCILITPHGSGDGT